MPSKNAAALRWLACSTLALSAAALHAESERFAVIDNGENVGHVYAEIDGNHVTIDHDVKSNGRGPTMHEDIVLGAGGVPVNWTLTGTSTFGNAVDERFTAKGGALSWADTTGKGALKAKTSTLYVAQEGSPFSLGIYARALLADAHHALPAAPGGALSLEEEAPVTLGGTAYKAYLVKGIGLTPSAILLDDAGRLVAAYSPTNATLREDLATYAGELGRIAATRSAERFAAIQKKVAHSYDAPIRIRDVRVFDPASGKLGDPVSVVVFGDRIAAIEPLGSPASPGEVTVEGAGRVVIPGLHDMHAHVSLQSALLYIASGVTSVRDMGNDNAFLIDLTRRIEQGEVAGPRIVRNGFLEGRSPYSSRNGFIVDSEAEALDAVRWYGARGYWQVKIYNSFHPEWVPAVAAEAKRLGMGVTGHIPAFTNADAMIAAGYDEVTHINQLMLGWVLDPKEDTRTPLRLTAMRRTAGLDLNSPRVTATLDTMQAKHIALDPTAVTLELLMLSRNGTISPAVAGYFDHLPVGVQRNRRQGIAPIASPADAAAYDGSFVTIKALLRDMYGRGITLLPGTDDQTGLSLHRELQIYAEAGIPTADVLRIGTLGPERYMHRDQSYGSVEKGKYADFVLLDGNPLEDMSALHRMAMVVKGGTVYFPSEIWSEVGVKPFAAAPKISVPPSAPKQAALTNGDDVHEDFAF
ncbi:imidazolonepropionase-like amidohydrolase [Novosphingobium sp. PhB165]|uniref:amidohydrolase family protein n=1 Tax=Novosphingobium sp. PhB165 TaxID=2485105 RepID=UPI0010475FDF|nr:amidohydrolase family protein [Novosphingobium sp. PhB165]TCM15416.1 imidazolonepropionase-like amidohydrolase [Novosphingobium sp. PhB165]